MNRFGARPTYSKGKHVMSVRSASGLGLSTQRSFGFTTSVRVTLYWRIAVNGGQPDVVADADPLERTEQTIAVRRKRAVARLPRQGSIRQIAHGEIENAGILAGFDRRRDVQPRDIEPADEPVRRDGRRDPRHQPVAGSTATVPDRLVPRSAFGGFRTSSTRTTPDRQRRPPAAAIQRFENTVSCDGLAASPHSDLPKEPWAR